MFRWRTGAACSLRAQHRDWAQGPKSGTSAVAVFRGLQALAHVGEALRPTAGTVAHRYGLPFGIRLCMIHVYGEANPAQAY